MELVRHERTRFEDGNEVGCGEADAERCDEGENPSCRREDLRHVADALLHSPEHKRGKCRAHEHVHDDVDDSSESAWSLIGHRFPALGLFFAMVRV